MENLRTPKMPTPLQRVLANIDTAEMKIYATNDDRLKSVHFNQFQRLKNEYKLLTGKNYSNPNTFQLN